MSIVELLEKVGAENCQVQFIDQSCTGAKMCKSGETEVSFLTREMSPDDLLGYSKKIGMVVWFDRDKWPK